MCVVVGVDGSPEAVLRIVHAVDLPAGPVEPAAGAQRLNAARVPEGDAMTDYREGTRGRRTP